MSNGLTCMFLNPDRARCSTDSCHWLAGGSGCGRWSSNARASGSKSSSLLPPDCGLLSIRVHSLAVFQCAARGWTDEERGSRSAHFCYPFLKSEHFEKSDAPPTSKDSPGSCSAISILSQVCLDRLNYHYDTLCQTRRMMPLLH